MRHQLHIGGQWRDGSAGTFAVHDPSTGQVVTDFANASTEDCLAAVDAAAAAFDSWAATAPRVRGELLRATFELLTHERDELADLIVRENGKAWPDAVGEASYAIEFFRWFSEEAVRVRGDFRLAPAGDKHILVDAKPIGVSVLITPWNFPAAMATRKIAPALAAGCTVVLKPAGETPLTAAYIVDAMVRAGLPDGVVNLVTPSDVGPAVSAMLHHPAVRKLSFTGSTEVGRILLRESADHVLSASMELGGNAPFLVLPGADLEQAVAGAMVAKMRNGGSACTAANRFYVHRSLHDDFAARLAEEMGAMPMGPGVDHDNRLGALVSLAERDKVARLVEQGITEGARVELGGEPSAVGAFYPATVLTGVEHGGTLTSTEVFGPVAPIVVFDEVAEAVRMANDTIFGLIAYVYGEPGAALRIARRIDAGMVGVNRALVSDPAAPFGGMKQSGLGREGAEEGVREFLEEQYLAIEL